MQTNPKLFLLSEPTANLACHCSSSLSHEIAGQARVSELCRELQQPENHFPSPNSIESKNASKLLQYLSAIARQITFTENWSVAELTLVSAASLRSPTTQNCSESPQARTVALQLVSHGF